MDWIKRLSSVVARYRQCQQYSDVGTVARHSYFGDSSIKSQLTFETSFIRDKAFYLNYASNSSSLPTHTHFSYDWKEAQVVCKIADNSEYKDIGLEAALRTLNASSCGAAIFVPNMLIAESLHSSWQWDFTSWRVVDAHETVESAYIKLTQPSNDRELEMTIHPETGIFQRIADRQFQRSEKLRESLEKATSAASRASQDAERYLSKHLETDKLIIKTILTYEKLLIS